MQIFNGLKSYFKEYYLIYAGVILCTVAAFSFHKLVEVTYQGSVIEAILLIIFFLISFFLPIVLSIVFTIRCFKQSDKQKLLIEIIHAYAGVVLIFAALYFQSIVLSDLVNAFRKDKIYTAVNEQYTLKELNSLKDRRAFKGIEKRLWSSYDYPGYAFVENVKQDSLKWRIHSFNNFETVDYNDIKQVIALSGTNFKSIYLTENIPSVYLDCLYFSLISVATVGFGDISPHLWHLKLFVMLEIVIGMSIFIFAIGFLFSDFKIR